ncbi:MAG: major capsid protein [Tepidisphaeraceae bacterium]
MAMTLKDYAAQEQDMLRQGLIDMLWQSSRIASRLNFIGWNGLSYPYSKRTKRPGVGTRSLNGSFTIAPGNVSPDTETLAILGGAARTDTVMNRFKPNLRENEIAGTIESGGLLFDRLFIKGDPTQTGKANEFYGLYARMPASQKIAMATNGATPTAAKVSELLDMVSGPNSEKKLLMPRTTRRLLSDNVKGSAGGKGVFDVGLQLTSYDNAEIVEVEKDESDNEIMPFTETQGSSSVASSILCCRFGGAVDERDVQGILGLQIGVEATVNYGTYLEDTIQMVGGIGIFGGYSIAQLTGVLAA